jgi:hypothetical protein
MVASRPERNAETSFRDNAAGPPSEAPANNARPNDLKVVEHTWALPNTTLAERAKKAAKRGEKQVDAATTEDKSVAKADTKNRR